MFKLERPYMNITSKTLLIVGMAFILLISTLAVVSNLSVLSGFADIETENARVDGIRVLNEINDDVATLNATVGDWAPWDETYQFIKDLNDGYITANLADGTLANIRVNFMIFINTSGQILYSSFAEPATGKTSRTPDGLGADILANPDLLEHKDLVSGRSGILKTAQSAILVASRPIVKNDFTGPSRGTLVMGRYFDDNELQRINDTTKLNTQMVNWDDGLLPEDYRTAKPQLSDANPIFIKPLGKNLIATYLMLKDFSGRPVVMLKVSADRKIYQTGLRTWWYYVASMAGIGLLFTLLIMAVLHRIVLSPMSRLNRNVQSIGSARNFYARLPVQTTDELGQLAVEINKMLEELSSAGKKLSEQSYQSGLSEMASDILHQIRNSMSPIIGNMDLMEKCMDQAGFKRINQALDELETGTSSQSRHNDLMQFIHMAMASLENMLTDIREHLNNARGPVSDIENVLQEYQLTAEIQSQIDPIDLIELVKDALKKIEPTEAFPGQVILDPGLSLMGKVLGNRVSLLNIVKVLLIATAQFIKKDGGSKNKIHISAKEISGENQDMVLLSIMNKGEGPDPKILDRIFEREFSSPQEGRPTSLHWCANVVNAMGGRLHTESNGKNQEAGFHLTLPRAGSVHIFEEKNTYGN